MQNATWFGIGTFGSLTVGSTVTTSVSFFDPNGNSDGIVHTGYIIEEPIGFGFSSRTVVSDPSNPSDSIRILPEWAGKTLLVSKGFFDDTNVLEERTFTVGQIPGGSASTNTAPVAGNDTATATAGQSVTINIGANDSDADSDRLTTTGVTNPTKGTVSYTDNFSTSDTATYRPFSTATGTDSFTYQVSDGKGGTDTAIVTVTISSANRDPVALNDTATATAGVATSINIGSNDSDPDGDNLIVSGVAGRGPTKGTVIYQQNASDTIGGLAESGDSFLLSLGGYSYRAVYTPFSSATGTDSFTYQVSDGKGGTDTATVTVTITAADLAGDTSTRGRINVGESVVGTHESGDFRDWYAVSLIGGKTYIIDLEGTSTGAGTLSDPIVEVFTGFSAFNAGFDNNSGIGTNAKLNFTPTSTGTYYLSSASALENNVALGTYKLTITQQNKIPVANNDTVSTRPGLPVTINIGLNDSDADNDPLATTGLSAPLQGTVR